MILLGLFTGLAYSNLLDCQKSSAPSSITSHSQWMQDWFTSRNIKSPGRFIEIGAFHPFFLSNTLLLERCYGWRGACVEPNPTVHDAFRSSRACHLIPACAWSDSKNMTLAIFNDPIEGRIVGTIDNSTSISYKARCLTLNQIVEHHDRAFPLDRDSEGRKIIDALLIDAEGSELEILSAFDFKKYSVRMVMYEAAERAFEVELILLNAGFEKVAVLGGDWVFINTAK